MRILVQYTALILLPLFVTGCSLFGGSSKEIQPSELVDFTEEKEIKVLWSEDLSGDLGEKQHQFQPAIWQKQIFAADVEGGVKAFDRFNGNENWSIDLDETLSGGVGAGYDALSVSTEAGQLVVLNTKDGSERWRAELSTEVVAHPQLNKDIILVQLINGSLEAYNIHTGVRIWVYDALIPRLTVRGTSTPLMTDEASVAAFANGKLAAVETATGRELWQRRIAVAKGTSELERLLDIDGRPLFVDGLIFAAGYQGSLVALDPSTAQVVWSQNMSTHHSLTSGFGNLYISDTEDRIQAVDQKTGVSVWQQTALSHRQIGAPEALGNTVVVGDFDGYLHFLSQIDGHFVARYEVGSDALRSDPLVADGILYILDNGGELTALQLQ